jgi:hypothetical protein
MGQSASQPAPLKSFEGKDLVELKDTELQVLMQMRPWTKDEVFIVARSLMMIPSQQSSSSSPSSSSKTSGFYSKEDDSPEAEIAVRLNCLSQELAKLRFSMVPSRVKEPIFWESIFTILRERLVEHNAKFTLTELLEAQQEKDDDSSSSTVTSTTNGYHHQQHHHPHAPSTKASTSFPDDEVKTSIRVVEPHTLQGQIAHKDLQIAALQHEIEKLQAALHAKPIGHKGEWVMDKDSQDFISYPEEIKDNMRREKQKRLQQVEQDMKFIIDSDEVEASNGHWPCCGETKYKSTCLKSKR